MRNPDIFRSPDITTPHVSEDKSGFRVSLLYPR